ncbi:MAG: hypothetical protein V7L20_26180 [Nostoc sp.]|uniref:hypothetical protein n=1 Tax=Nostoc sp. TaxID=1180 RepID=UPI002FFBD12C
MSSIESDSETGAIVICALRYCLGRRTYMPSLVVDWTKRHWAKLAANDQKVIWRDLDEAITNNRDLGDACDIQTWHSFYQWIKEQENFPAFSDSA